MRNTPGVGSAWEGKGAMQGPRRQHSGQKQLSQWALEHLVDVSVRQWLKGFRPFDLHGAPLTLRPDLAIPADLLHVVIEL